MPTNEEIPTKLQKCQGSFETKKKQIEDLANNFLKKAVINKVLTISEVTVKLNDEGDYDYVALKCPLGCPKPLSLSIKRNVSPRYVLIGNLKNHLDRMHRGQNSKSKTFDKNSVSLNEQSETEIDSTIFDEFIEEVGSETDAEEVPESSKNFSD